MKKTLLIILIVAAFIALAVFLILKYVKKDNGKNGNGNGNGNGGTPPPPPSPGKTLKDYVGSTVTAKYSTKLYDNDLNVVATYDAGDKIGWMGNEATGYTCCTNRPGFYKIYDVVNAPGGSTSGWCSCEYILSAETLKYIFGI